MTHALKQYRYKPLFEILNYDQKTQYFRLYNTDDNSNRSVSKEEFECDYEPAEQAAQGWRPISEAPIGVEVILYREGFNNLRIGSFQHTSDAWLCSETQGIMYPTHWQYLPKPPAREGDGA